MMKKEKRGEKAHENFIDIWEDIAEECAKFGNIVDMKIPKPQKDQQVPGCGLVSFFFLTSTLLS